MAATDDAAGGGPLAGRIALVTGGATGIGAGICVALASAGAAVIVGQPDPAHADGVLREIATRGGVARAVPLDIRSRASVTEALRQTLDHFGQLDVLVNNAALSGIDVLTPFLTCSDDLLDAVIDVNLKGTFICSQEAARAMVPRGRGSIVHISSVGAFAAQEGADAYCATKAALTALTQTMALGLAPHGIRVNAVAPGDIQTEKSIEGGDALRRRGLAGTYSRRVPLGRRGQPADIGAAVVFLASDAAAYITGETIVVDGGLLSY